MNVMPLTGTWTLVAWYNQAADGSRVYPFGEAATGYISYSPDGFVFVHLMAEVRAPFASGDPFGATLQEESDAMKTHISYAGRFTFAGSSITHHVTQSSIPNWVGTDQVRRVELEGDRLRLSATGMRFNGQDFTASLDWRRAVA